ncbi:MAG: DUF2905 domain-containing protein [Candidatus Omnitrophota bacterium]|nr:MAG: DUF2905 domain-containing protein [Candidatus Omnitrophota bacterium]
MDFGIGKILIAIGVIFILFGTLILLTPHIPFLGKLPGDIRFEGKRFHVFFPIMTCIVLSVLLSLILNIIRWWR